MCKIADVAQLAEQLICNPEPRLSHAPLYSPMRLYSNELRDNQSDPNALILAR